MEVIVFTIVALILGVILIVLDYFFNREDKKVLEVLSFLPNLNCGSCGHGGCLEMARSIVNDNEDINKCRPLRGVKKEELERYLNQK